MGDFPSPVFHRCAMCIGVLSSAMPLRYDRLCRITPRSYVCRSEHVYIYTRSAVAYAHRVRQGVARWEGGKERETGHHSLYGDQGGCPVFRVTWLNGIALAHSCPHRRDGRLASRFFPPLFGPRDLARVSLAKTVSLSLSLILSFFFGRSGKRSATRCTARIECARQAKKKPGGSFISTIRWFEC